MSMYHVYTIAGPRVEWIVNTDSHDKAKRQVTLFVLGSPTDANDPNEYQEFTDNLGTRRYEGNVVQIQSQISVRDNQLF